MSRRNQLPEILAAHALWLDTDGREGARADLSRVNLNGAKLAGARLQNANLRHAQLGGTDFTGADLRGADLRGAKLVVTITGYNELDLPREYATANFTGAQLAGVLADVSLGGTPPAPRLIAEPEPQSPDPSARFANRWPVSLEQMEALVRRAGGVLDPQLTQVGALMKTTDDGAQTSWLRTNAGCALSALVTKTACRIQASTRFGGVVLSASQDGPLIVEVKGSAEQEAAVLAELRAALG